MCGIECAPFLYWEKEGESWEVGQYQNPDDGLTPAWTKTELDYMIGNNFSKPDLIKPDKAGKFGSRDIYPLYALNKIMEYTNGAEASAAALLFLIENEQLDVTQINERFEKFFS